MHAHEREHTHASAYVPTHINNTTHNTGIETVRRDNCSLVKDVITTCLDKILIEKSVEGALDYTKQMISDLLCNRVDLSNLVISKSLGKCMCVVCIYTRMCVCAF